MTEIKPNAELTTLDALAEAPHKDSGTALPPETATESETLALPSSQIDITGDGNTIGNDNVTIVAKDGGTVNFNTRVSVAEMLIAALKKLGISDDEVVNRLLDLLTSCSNNPDFSPQDRDRAYQAGLKVAGRTLLEIQIDKDLLAVIGLFLTGKFFQHVVTALRRDCGEASPPSEPTPQPAQTKPRRKLFEPELIFIPAGEFTMGTSRREIAVLRRQYDWARDFDFNREQPQHTVHLPDYSIGKYPVTNAQYLTFVQATGHRAPGYWDGERIPRGEETHPVKWLWWQDAVDYCAWLAEATRKPYRLPTEAEWEKAARGPAPSVVEGTGGRRYPWGDEPPSSLRCNFDNNEKGTTPVGHYSPRGDSLYDCVDMAGNVWEWTSTRWGPDWREAAFTYPYKPDARETMVSKDYRIARGGSYWSDECWLRCAARLHDYRSGILNYAVGVRVCVSASFSQ